MDDQLKRMHLSLDNIQNSLKRFKCNIPNDNSQSRILTESITPMKQQIGTNMVAMQSYPMNTQQNEDKQQQLSDNINVDERVNSSNDQIANCFGIKHDQNSKKQNPTIIKHNKPVNIKNHKKTYKSLDNLQIKSHIHNYPQHLFSIPQQQHRTQYFDHQLSCHKKQAKKNKYVNRKDNKPSTFTIKTTYIFNENSKAKSHKLLYAPVFPQDPSQALSGHYILVRPKKHKKQKQQTKKHKQRKNIGIEKQNHETYQAYQQYYNYYHDRKELGKKKNSHMKSSTHKTTQKTREKNNKPNSLSIDSHQNHVKYSMQSTMPATKAKKCQCRSNSQMKTVTQPKMFEGKKTCQQFPGIELNYI